MSDVITPVYGGRATVTFKTGNHVYTVQIPEKGITDLWQPSVTGIIRVLSKADVLVPWAIREMVKKTEAILATLPAGTPLSSALVSAILKSAQETYREKRDEAADIGTLVHNYLEEELLHRSKLGPPPALPAEMNEDYLERVNNSIGAGLQFLDTHKIRLVQAEAPRWSPTHGFIGTGDAIAFVDDELTVLDYKTSKRLYSTVFLQLAAYQFAYEEEFPGQKILKRLAINVGRDGVLTTESRDNLTYTTDFACFLALLTAWRWDRTNQGSFSKPAPPVIGALN